MKILFATDANGVKFYPITIANAVAYIKQNGDQVKLNEFLDSLNASNAGKADKVANATEGNFAGLDANGNLTDSGKNYTSIKGEIDAAEQNAKAYTDGLIAGLDAEKSQAAGADGLALSITEVDGKITAISGSIAANTYDAHGAAAAVLGQSGDADSSATVYGAKAYADTKKSEVVGASTDLASANTINGAKKYADDAVAAAMTSIAGALVHKGVVNSNADLPAAANVETGWQYTVATAGTYDGAAMEVGDYLIWNGTGWDKVNGENQVTNEGASLVIGTATKVATVDGTDITVTQVEDLSKIEAVPVADTTEYADVTALFTAPAGA